MKEATQALERLGVSTRRRGAGGGRCRLRSLAGATGRAAQYIATSDEFPRIKITLEMVGKGQPRILDWEVKQPPF